MYIGKLYDQIKSTLVKIKLLNRNSENKKKIELKQNFDLNLYFERYSLDSTKKYNYKKLSGHLTVELKMY